MRHIESVCLSMHHFRNARASLSALASPSPAGLATCGALRLDPSAISVCSNPGSSGGTELLAGWGHHGTDARRTRGAIAEDAAPGQPRDSEQIGGGHQLAWGRGENGSGVTTTKGWRNAAPFRNRLSGLHAGQRRARKTKFRRQFRDRFVRLSKAQFYGLRAASRNLPFLKQRAPLPPSRCH
jgi:hypothetical protein